MAQGGVWVATPQGLRYMDGSTESVLLAPEDGLEYANQAQVFSLPNGLVSVSSLGHIARKEGAGPFRIINRSYVGAERKLVPRLGCLAQSILVLPFEGSLAFFDLRSEKSVLTLLQVGALRLESHPITALLVQADTLYVAMGQRVFRRTMDWDSLARDRSLADPSTWSEQLLSHSDTIRSIALKGDSLVFRTHEGTFEFDSQGRETSTCVEEGCVVRIQGEVREDSLFYANGQSLVRWILKESDQRIWFVGTSQAWLQQNGTVQEISAWDGFSLGLVNTLASLPNGGVLAWAQNQYSRYQGPNFGPVHTVNPTDYLDDWNQDFAQPLKSVAVGSDGSVAFGTWGAGMLHWSDGDTPQLLNWYHPKSEGCLTGFAGGNYTLMRGVVAAPGGGFLFSYVMPEGSYGLGYLSAKGAMTCYPHVGSKSYAGPLVVRESLDSSGWDLFVAYGGSLDVNVEGGVDWFHLPLTGLGTPHSPQLRQTMVSEVGYPRDLALQFQGERLWVMGASNLGYWDPGQEKIQAVPYLKGYSGGELSALAVDVQEGVWLGTMGKGAYRLIPVGLSFDSLAALQFLPRQGLLSTRVYDIAIDSRHGEVWFALDNGVSRLRYAAVRDASSYMTAGAPPVKVFPNPFRPREHSQVFIDHVNEKATVYILDAFGQKLRQFQGSDFVGGRVVWDGTNTQGKRVAPGVYHYWIVAGGKTTRGKILVEH